MKKTLKKISKYSLLTLIGLLASCTREDTDDCFTGLRLNFDFTLHTNEGNKFGDDVQSIRVYLFDSKGVLQHIESRQGTSLTNDYVMDISVHPGTYTVFAWGGSNEDFYNSYHEGHMNDPVIHDYENGVTIGKTTLTDFRVFINYGIADDFPEDIIPTVDELDDLYYGAVGRREPITSKYAFEPVEVTFGNIVERNIELIRNTNILKVTITGLEYFEPDHARAAFNVLNVWATARNGRYKYDNTIGEYARLIRYRPHVTKVDQDTLIVDIKLMRLDMERHTAEPVYLTIEDPVTGAVFPKQPIDVVNLLLQARDPVTGDYIYQSQEDFDRIYEHPIRVDISADLTIRIFIHDWEIILLTPTAY